MKKRLLVAIVAIILSAALVFAGCGGNETSETPEATATPEASATEVENTQVGLESDEKSFIFEVVDKNGEITQTTVISDGKYVGEVLQEFELIEGEEGPYGIYIKKVNGITADYDVDGTYWAFYVDGELSMTGADQVEIVEGATYSFRVETM